MLLIPSPSLYYFPTNYKILSIQSHKMEPPLIDDLQSMSFNSTTTTATDAHRSISSGSDRASSSTQFPSSTALKPHSPSGASIRLFPSLSLSDLRFLRRLGTGDIGAVYLAELKHPPSDSETNNFNPTALFAAKVMDKKELENRKKEGRARTEREILEMLNHPFLPKLYATIESPKWSCLLTEFCPGGDLHVLRQLQPCKRFPDSAVRFYASEVVVALEYLHMMGIVYRDLKPENVLVRPDGHIMLTDFDLSLRCDDSTFTPTQLVYTRNPHDPPPSNEHTIDPPPFGSTSCILPNCIVPAVSCFHLKRKCKKKLLAHHMGPEFVAEPIDVRSMSFVGTHEYLAPEIVSCEGHGSAVDWWTLGIFIFEMLYGFTPFRGTDHEITLANIVARALEFPMEPHVPAAAKDLISQLLAKDPERRMGATMGSSAIKRHPFFHGVNWALLRCTDPPFVPCFSRDFLSDESCPGTPVDYY